MSKNERDKYIVFKGAKYGKSGTFKGRETPNRKPGHARMFLFSEGQLYDYGGGPTKEVLNGLQSPRSHWAIVVIGGQNGVA